MRRKQTSTLWYSTTQHDITQYMHSSINSNKYQQYYIVNANAPMNHKMLDLNPLLSNACPVFVWWRVRVESRSVVTWEPCWHNSCMFPDRLQSIWVKAAHVAKPSQKLSLLLVLLATEQMLETRHVGNRDLKRSCTSCQERLKDLHCAVSSRANVPSDMLSDVPGSSLRKAQCWAGERETESNHGLEFFDIICNIPPYTLWSSNLVSI